MIVPITVSQSPSSLGSTWWITGGSSGRWWPGRPAAATLTSRSAGARSSPAAFRSTPNAGSAPGLHLIPLRLGCCAFALTALAGLIYAPHSAPRRRRLAGLLGRLFAYGPPPPRRPERPPPIQPISSADPTAGGVRLIGAGKIFAFLAVTAALLGLLPTSAISEAGRPAATGIRAKRARRRNEAQGRRSNRNHRDAPGNAPRRPYRRQRRLGTSPVLTGRARRLVFRPAAPRRSDWWRCGGHRGAAGDD